MTQRRARTRQWNAQESALVALFPQATGFNVNTGTLTLTGSGGATLLTYTAGLGGLEAPRGRRPGKNGKGGVESTALTESLTATFDPSGAFSGFGGRTPCRAPTRPAAPTDSRSRPRAGKDQDQLRRETDALETRTPRPWKRSRRTRSPATSSPAQRLPGRERPPHVTG